MQEKNQRLEKNQKQDKVLFNNRFLANYIDIVIRGVITFCIFVFIVFFIMKISKLPFYLIFPIIFILSILISPLLSKIKLGDKIQDKYDNFLNKIIKKIKK